jgi:Putative transposase/Transposase zinc-binding domain
VEFADIVRAHAGQLTGLSVTQQQVLRAIADCRTAVLGGHRRECPQCGHQEIAYNSCRNRHCPKCQGLEAARWIDAQQPDLLPVPYFHVVFTVPAELHALFLAAPRVTYPLLFAAVAETLAQVALRRLGAKIAVTAVLHTWPQLLLFHPHLHCIVPGGGLDPGHTRWIAARADFFLPVRVLAEVFRGKLLAALEKAIDRAEIPRQRDDDPHAPLKRAATQRWVVYCKPPFGGPEQVLAYLAHYTHRIALANDRLLSLHEGQVTFRWKDRAHGNASRVATVEAEAFLRRFLLHVLPDRFVRIRHYGWLANCARQRLLPTVRAVLGLSAPLACTPPPVEPETWEATLLRLTGKDVTRCPCCGAEGFLIVEAVSARAQPDDFPLRVRSP